MYIVWDHRKGSVADANTNHYQKVGRLVGAPSCDPGTATQQTSTQDWTTKIIMFSSPWANLRTRNELVTPHSCHTFFLSALTTCLHQNISCIRHTNIPYADRCPGSNYQSHKTSPSTMASSQEGEGRETQKGQSGKYNHSLTVSHGALVLPFVSDASSLVSTQDHSVWVSMKTDCYSNIFTD